MSGWGIFFIIVVILLVLAAIGWVMYAQPPQFQSISATLHTHLSISLNAILTSSPSFTHLRARRLGLPPPSLNPFASRSSRPYSSDTSGIKGWFSSVTSRLRNRRSAAGAYEETSLGSATTPHSSTARGGRHGFGPLDPDEAWDSRVGHEADVYEPGGYYEEQELPLRNQYPGQGFAATPPTPGFGVGGESERGGRGRPSELDERYDEEMGRGRRENPFGDHAEAGDVALRGVSPRPIDTSAGHSRGHHGDSPTERRSMFREDM
ncbi:MAG: hypothetical protein M1820_005544 [Bogoriella megaspora]|nr:MAG: hypothetical protein M1820_005544 [Bogoriella megaspora]